MILKLMFSSLFLVPMLHGQAIKPRVEIALLLDTSSSMDGLIDQAKSQLWRIINELALAKKRGQTPHLRVALFEYGKSSLVKADGYLQMLVPLTGDLDRVSEALFSLNTNGGQEYCGRVIGEASRRLDWSAGNRDYRAIFIAGNEPFNQGSVNFRQSCAGAIAKGIVVNTIFCGKEAEGISTYWKEGADLADGRFMVIDQNQQLVHLEAPQDGEILKLGQQLNQTYVAYGRTGEKAKERQKKQDSNAAVMADEVAVQRVLTKASPMYKNESWDLVEAAESGAVDVTEVAEEELPEPMKDMDDAEKKAYVEARGKQRHEIQAKLKRLQAERRQYLASQQNETTLDHAILAAIRAQLQAKSFEFDN